MTLGLPVVSTDCAGPNELLDHGKYGLLVDNNDISLYEGISTVINDSKLREDLKQKSKVRSHTFGVKETLNALDDLVQTIK